MENIVYCIEKRNEKYRVVTCEKKENGRVVKLAGIIDNKVDRIYYNRQDAKDICFKLNHPKQTFFKKAMISLGYLVCATALVFSTYVSLILAIAMWG